jgi:hypothetical protein
LSSTTWLHHPEDWWLHEGGEWQGSAFRFQLSFGFYADGPDEAGQFTR